MRSDLNRHLWISAFLLLWPAIASADALTDGRTAFQAGDIRNAVIQLRNAVRADPQNAEAHFLLAKVQLEMGNIAAAQKEALSARVYGYDIRQVLPVLGITYMILGKYADALQEFQVEGKDPVVDSLILIIRGQAYTALQQLDEAEEAYTKAEILAPRLLQPAVASTQLAISRGDIATAKQKFEHAQRIAPNALEVQLLKSQFLRMDNDAPGALAVLNELINRQPNAFRARLDRASLYLLLNRDAEAKADIDAILAIKPNDVQAIFNRALLAARAGDFTLADNQLDKISRFLGRLPRAFYLQAVVKENLGLMEQAEEAATRFSAREPNDLDGIKLLSRIQLLKQNPVPVIIRLNAAAAAGKADFDIYDLLGRALSINGEPADAVEAFRRAQMLEPDNIGVNTRLANAHLQNGESEAAVADLERALRLAPDDAGISEALVAASLATGDVASASAILNKVRASLGNAPTVGNLEAVVLMARLDLPAARSKLEDVIRRAPDYTLARYNLARLALMEGKKDEADQLLTSILSKTPAADPALSMYIGGLLGAGDVAGAIKALELARANQPKNNRILLVLSDLYVRLGEARRALALAGGDTPLSQIPTDLLGPRARAQIALAQVKDARDAYSELLDRDPGNIAVRRILAGLLVSNGDIESARNTLQTGLKITPRSLQLMQDLVGLDFTFGGVDPALRSADKYERLNADFPAARALRGDVFMAARRFDDAIAAYTSAMDDFDTPPTLLMLRLGTARYASGHPEAADRLLRDWVRTHPDDVAALQFLSDLDLTEKRYAEAEQDYLKLLEMRPHDPGFLNNLAWLYQLRGDKRARQTAQQAYILRPLPEIADTLGWIVLAEGDTNTALALLGQANGEAGYDPRIAYHYAVALHKANRDKEAIETLKPLVDANFTFDERPEAAKLLADLTRPQ